MKRILRPTLLAGPALVLGASFAVWAQLEAAAQAPASDLVLVPFTPTAVRQLSTVETAVFVYAGAPFDERVRLEEVRVSSGGDLVYSRELDLELVGDPRFGEVNATLERLPHDLAHNHKERRYFASPDAPEYGGAEALDVRREAMLRWNALSEEYTAGRPRPFVQVDFPLHTDQVFFPEEPEGTRREVEVRLVFSTVSGGRRTASVTRPITRLADPLGLPAPLAAVGASVHPGDLHVHSCHGEAAGACAPSSNCTAETLQLSGSFSYAQLRSQYEALGIDWFTATDHSYCINSTSEWNVIKAECAAATDADFLVLADIELSSDEVGSQTGSDSGDILCLGLTSANHMGAHQLTNRVAGGEDGLLGFCDGLFSDVLDSFTSNITEIRDQGGYPIVHHPEGSSFGWNSYSATTGIEAGGMHGVEIWNGTSQSGQGSHVGRWVDWMLDGRILYAYSGSDTHDEAHSFGANHVILGPGEVFNGDNVHGALRNGRHYISNEHSLVIEAELGGSILGMGSLNSFPASAPAASVTTRVHYNFGADSTVVTVFKGVVGAANETTVCESLTLTGQGTFTCSTPLVTGANSWVRAYSQSGSKTAYTNPIFFLPSADDPMIFCTAKTDTADCTPEIAYSGSASATSGTPFDISAAPLLNNKSGLLFYGYGAGFMPFFDGTLCATAPFVRTTVQNSGGNPTLPDCSGSFAFDFNAYVQSGADPNLGPGSTVSAQFWYRDPTAPQPAGLSNAVFFSVGP